MIHIKWNGYNSFIVFFLICLRTTAQTNQEYDSLVVLADKEYQNKNYIKCVTFYEGARKALNNRMKTNHYYDLACCYSRGINRDSALNILLRYSKAGHFYNLSHILSDEDLMELRKSKLWDSIVYYVSINYKRKSLNYNILLKRKLDTIYINDQICRNKLNEALIRNESNTPAFKLLQKTVDSIDKINLKTVTELLDEYGWISKDSIGDSASTALFLVIQHSDTFYQSKYINLLKGKANMNQAKPMHYAMLYDRLQMNRGLPQKYGTQVSFNEVTKKYELWKVESLHNIDIERKKMGMGSLKSYLEFFQIYEK